LGSGTATVVSSGFGTDTARSSAATTENVSASVAGSTNDVRVTLNGPDTTSTNMNWRVYVRIARTAGAAS